MKKKDSIFGGIIAGIICIIVGIGLLWWNEGRTVRTQKGINEAKENYVQVKSDKVDSKYEGKLVATNGKLDISNSEELVDATFNIKVASAKMNRVVEMYQWSEDCHTDDNNVEKCTYKKEWSDDLIDSSNFNKSGHENPSSMPYESETYLAEDVKLGAYDLPDSLVDNLSTKKEVKNEELSDQFADKIEGYAVDGKYITNVKADEDPVIGSVRVSFEYNDADSASVLAVQSGNTFAKYNTKSGTTIFRIKEGIHQGSEIIKDLIDENNFFKWLLRALGTLLVILGIGSIFSPIQKLTNFIPLLGGAVSLVTGLISFVAGLAISLIVIALAWFRFRPVLSISLLVVVAILIVILVCIKKKTKNASKELKEGE